MNTSHSLQTTTTATSRAARRALKTVIAAILSVAALVLAALIGVWVGLRAIGRKSPTLRPSPAIAAFLAGLGAGVWSSREELARTRRIDSEFQPGERNDAAHRRWRDAVGRSREWADA